MFASSYKQIQIIWYFRDQRAVISPWADEVLGNFFFFQSKSILAVCQKHHLNDVKSIKFRGLYMCLMCTKKNVTNSICLVKINVWKQEENFLYKEMQCSLTHAMLITNQLTSLLGLFTTIWSCRLVKYISYPVSHIFVQVRALQHPVKYNQFYMTPATLPLQKTEWE